MTDYSTFDLYIPWIPVALRCSRITNVQYDIHTDKTFIRVEEFKDAIDITALQTTSIVVVGQMFCIDDKGRLSIKERHWINDRYQRVVPGEKS